MCERDGKDQPAFCYCVMNCEDTSGGRRFLLEPPINNSLISPFFLPAFPSPSHFPRLFHLEATDSANPTKKAPGNVVFAITRHVNHRISRDLLECSSRGEKSPRKVRSVRGLLPVVTNRRKTLGKLQMALFLFSANMYCFGVSNAVDVWRVPSCDIFRDSMKLNSMKLM